MAMPVVVDSGGNEYLQPGDPLANISATEWNRHVDASAAYHRTKARGEPRTPRTGGSDTNIVKVKNVSGDDRRRGEILEFSDFALDDPADLDLPMLWLEGDTPTLANGFGVLLRATPEDDLEDCQVLGACFALVNVISASHQFASPKHGTCVLQSAPVGSVRILYKPSGTGEKECAVLLTGDSTHVVKPDQDIAIGDTDTCSVWLNESVTDADLELTALGAAVTADLYCLAWGGYVFPWECGS